MRHSCSLGLTYRAARDVTDGHVWHCTNKQPVDSAANTHTHWILHACENIRHTDTSFQVRSCENPALTTILSKPFAHLFYVYICNPWLLRSIHVIIYSIEDLHFWKTDVCVCRQKMSFVTVRVELRQLVDSPTGWLKISSQLLMIWVALAGQIYKHDWQINQ